MNLTEKEIKELKMTKSEKQWNATCDKIKHARGGVYPPDWWEKMALSGLMAEIFAQWKLPTAG